jgi:hypothetical protein
VSEKFTAVTDEELRKYRIEWAENRGTLNKISGHRAQFAAMAMQGMLAARPHCANCEDVAFNAVKYADALIKELNK